MIEALAGRDIASLFRLLKRYLGASQGRIGAATSLEQPDVSKIMNDRRATTSFERIERIATGLDMPDDARVRFGLAPRSYVPQSAERFRASLDQGSVIVGDSSDEAETGYEVADAADVAIGETIRRLRGSLSLSLRGLAERAHIDAGHLSKLENGKRRLTPEFAVALDGALDSGDELARLADSRKSASRGSVSASALSGSRVPTTDGGVGPREVDPMLRREFLALGGLGVGAASLGGVAGIRGSVLDAARSSAMLSASVQSPGVSEFATAVSRQRLYRLATDYALTSDLTTLSELVELRNELYTTLTTRQYRPHEAREVYLLLGAACVLLSSISHDLSEPKAGITQAASAEVFAELSGHQGLLTWVYCTKAMISSWWASPEEVLSHTQKAHAVGAVGVPAVRLAGLEARALAQMGRGDEAVAVLNVAQDQREKLDGRDDLQELGEVFTFPLPRQHYYNASAYLHLGNWAEVERETRKVADLYDAPAAGQPWPVTLTLTRIYQAQARLQQHGPEGAFEALSPVFGMPDKQRIPQTSRALDGLHSQLHRTSYAAISAARDLSEAIGSFQSRATR